MAMVEQDEKNIIRITNQQRIIRIFTKICQSKLQVFIRANQSSSVIVKGRAESLDFIKPSNNDENKVLIVKGLSEKGVKYLFGKNNVQIEFVMMSSKIVCQCKVFRLRNDHIILSLPNLLVSLERRSGARYKTTDNLRAFVAFSFWTPRKKDFSAPPFFPHHREFSTFLPVVDISLGGICLVTTFPFLNKIITNEVVDSEAKLYIPMHYALALGLGVRWLKKRTEHIKTTSGESHRINTYLIGCKFMQNSDENSQAIKRFIQQLIEAKAI